MAHVDKRLWRTEKGDLVEDGHEEAQFLVYTPGDVLSDSDKDKVRKAATKQAPTPANKKSPAPTNKQAVKPADK